MRLRVPAAILTSLALAACGAGDDGASVRTIGGDGESSASASASGVASASGSMAAGVSCETVGDPASAEATVPVTLTEWSITPEGDVPAGSVAFEATNAGAEPHELVIVQGVALADLPTDEDGALDESALPEGALVGEIEPFPGGSDCSGAFDLEAGDYVFLCNIVETEADGTVESHLAEGMATEVTVS